MKKRSKPLRSLTQIELSYVPKRYRKPHLYPKHRIRHIKESIKEAKKNKDFTWGLEFLKGRLSEAEQMERFYKRAEKKK